MLNILKQSIPTVLGSELDIPVSKLLGLVMRLWGFLLNVLLKILVYFTSSYFISQKNVEWQMKKHNPNLSYCSTICDKFYLEFYYDFHFGVIRQHFLLYDYMCIYPLSGIHFTICFFLYSPNWFSSTSIAIDSYKNS